MLCFFFKKCLTHLRIQVYHTSTTGEGVEPDYFTEPDDIGVVDESDTPVDVAIEHVLAESAGAPHGFVVRDDGALA